MRRLDNIDILRAANEVQRVVDPDGASRARRVFDWSEYIARARYEWDRLAADAHEEPIPEESLKLIFERVFKVLRAFQRDHMDIAEVPPIAEHLTYLRERMEPEGLWPLDASLSANDSLEERT